MPVILCRLKAFSTGIVLFVFSLLFVDLSPAHSGESPLIGIGKTSSGVEGVIIKAIDVSLADLLKKIESQSGIDFKINSGLLDESISVDIEATTWTKAVQEVLKDYNRVELWGRDQKLTGVYVVEVLNLEGPYFAEPSLGEEKGKTGHIAPNNKQVKKKEIPLSKGQLVKLARGPYRSPISSKLWEDAQFQKFLKQHGIRDRYDLTNLQKARSIRRAARKQLRDLQKNRPVR